MKLFEMLDQLSPQREGPTTSQAQNVSAFTMNGAVPNGGMGLTSTQPNVFGGENFSAGGHQVGYSQPNVFGGENFYAGGQQVGYSQPNVFGGQDHYLGGQHVGSTQPNVFGGENFSVGGHQVGYSQPNVFGGENLHGADGSLDAFTMPNAGGGFDVY